VKKDIDQFRALVQKQFADMVDREGTGALAPMEATGEEPPCPGCGNQAPLVEGACSDCGLVLE
jgi:hypothetical protein